MKRKHIFYLFSALAMLMLIFDSSASSAHGWHEAIFGGGLFGGLRASNPQSWAEVEARSKQNLSSYYGDSYYGSNYTGVGDEFIHQGYSGAAMRSFQEETARAVNFTIVVTSTHTSTQNLLLCPGLNWVQGGTNTGVIKDGAVDGLTNLSCSGSPGTILSLINQFRNNPIRLLGMRIRSDQAAQIDVSLTHQPQSAFRTEASQPISLATYTDENTYKDKMVTVDLRQYNMQLDNQTTITLPIVASSVTNIVLFLGAQLNTAKALEVKSSIAQSNVGGMRVIELPSNVAPGATVSGGPSGGTMNLNTQTAPPGFKYVAAPGGGMMLVPK